MENKRIEELVKFYEQFHTVRDLIDISAERFTNKPFIKYVDGNGEIVEKSFIDLRDNSLAICRYIRSVCPERMHVGIIGKTSYEYITAMTGALVSGNVFVPFAPNITVEEAVELFEQGDIEALFYEDTFAETAKAIEEKYGRLKVCINMGNAEWFADIYKDYDHDSEYAPLSEVELNPEDCATIIYTSGTTGKRKGVMLSSANLIANITYTEFEQGDEVLLSVLPMHHIFCFTSDYFKSLLEGFTVCLNGDISKMGENLARFQPTTMRMVPMIAETLIRKINILHKRFPQLTAREAAEKVFGKNISWIAVGGAYVSPNLIDEYEKHGIILRQGYGMSETAPKVTTGDNSNNHKYSSGKIMKSIFDVRIVDGEIQVKGKSVMMGYYKMPEETAKAFTEDGYLRTGDLGRISDDGEHLYVTGRAKNLIILSNGENISPEEIEKKFADEKVIKEIVVSSENDRIVAEIFPDSDFVAALEIENLEEYLQKKVDEANKGEKTEREIAILKIRETPFPKTSTGKIKRTKVTF
ncbi:MAG: AMP-binding protein [Clostridia bacterium]|nr:AMP-binding protein [Clostridia bacterium]